jgi:hypothetical protein
MNPRYDGTPEQDGPPDWFDDLHSDDPRSPEHNPPPNDQPEPEPQAKDIGSEYAEATGEADFADPVDILGNAEMAGYPELTPDCVPAVIYNHTMAEGHRMLADPVAIATHCLGATSLVISDLRDQATGRARNRHAQGGISAGRADRGRAPGAIRAREGGMAAKP